MSERSLTSLPEQVAWACRILAFGGHGDFTLGHVSARDAAGLVQMKRNGLGLEEVTAADVLTLDLDGRQIGGDGKKHLEFVLHTEVYQARPDVGGIVHTHPPYATALAATSAQIELINHDAVLFHDGVAVFDDTAAMITRPEQGKAVARALGTCRVVLLRNHGVLVVGKDVPWAVFTALTLERVVRIQALAQSLGPLCPMTPSMARAMFAEKFRDEFVATYWDYLIRQIRRAGFDAGMPGEANDASC